MAVCTKRVVEEMKELFQIKGKLLLMIALFLKIGLPQIGRISLQWMLVLTLFVW